MKCSNIFVPAVSVGAQCRVVHAGSQGQGWPAQAHLHIASMKELILSLRWQGGKQILRAEFECDLPMPRLPHGAQVRLSASLKAAYGNQHTQAPTVRQCVYVCGGGIDNDACDNNHTTMR